VEDRQTLPTEHKHQTAQAEHHHYDSQMAEEDAARLKSQQSGLESSRSSAPVERTVTEQEAKVRGVTHHHIHETIQPVVERETVAPTVVHQNVPVHEHITDRPIVHDQTVEPTLSMNEFRSKVSGEANLHSTSTHEHMKPNVIPSKGSSASGTGASGQ